MGRVVAGRAYHVNTFFAKTYKCVIIINPYRIGRGPGYQQPPQVPHSRVPVEIMLLLNIVKTKEKKMRKASEEAAESVERETLIRKGWYLKYRNNDWKGKRAGGLDGTKKCRHILPTESKVERE